MSNDGFAEVQRKLEAIASELKTATGPEQRRELLRVMSRLVAKAERISGQPLEISHKPEQPWLSKEKKSGNDSPSSLLQVCSYTGTAPSHALSSPRCEFHQIKLRKSGGALRGMEVIWKCNLIFEPMAARTMCGSAISIFNPARIIFGIRRKSYLSNIPVFLTAYQ